MINYQSTTDIEWAELRVTAPAESEELVSSCLSNFAANGVEIRDCQTLIKSETPDHILIVGYFPKQDSPQKQKQLQAALSDQEGTSHIDWTDRIQVHSLESEDWSTAWQRHFYPIDLTDRITVCPSWERTLPDGDRIVIEIDPGMAFGTGEHETTRLCAQAIERYLRPGDSVLDIGAGTALLSIIAERLGASSVTAIDNDPDAARSARENLIKNSTERVETLHIDLEKFDSRQHFDMVVGNLQTHIIRDNWRSISSFFSDRSVGIFSGILIEHESQLVPLIQQQGFQVIESSRLNEWLLIVVKKDAESLSPA
ncbi:MAG: ribosomal protein L11 methyltransferase [Candidatus Cloacimonetes bacterium 4572_55]|nr:MAG: ribosomal protein L11 methyltransferase [Candidatus Cloacimonetes bacterium 4572_55]